MINLNNNMDIKKMMEMLSKMDKTELEQNLNKVSKILNSKDADRVIDEIKKNTKE